MLVATHTNLMWYPDHLSPQFVAEAWQAKKAKMRLSPDVYFAGTARDEHNAFDSRPETLLEASEGCDKVIVFGIKAPHTGINAAQELIASFVRDSAIHDIIYENWKQVLSFN